MASKLTPLFVLPLFAVVDANAADMPVMLPPEVDAVNYLSVEGGPLSSDGKFDRSSDKYGRMSDERGFYGAATYRRLVHPQWDWQFTATGTAVDTSSSNFWTFRSDLDFQTVDLDLGYHPGANPLNRLLFGIRALHLNDTMTLSNGGGLYGSYGADGWAFGPRAGFQSETMLGGTRFGFVAEGSGSMLFGNFKHNYYDGLAAPTTSDSHRTVYNIEALAGLSWHITGKFTLTAGYRFQKWWNLREGATVTDSTTNPPFVVTADKDPLFHGPFLRAAITF